MKSARLYAAAARLVMALAASACGPGDPTAGTASKSQSSKSSSSASSTPCGLDDAVADLRSLSAGVDVGAQVQRSAIEPEVRSALRLRVGDKTEFVAASNVNLDLSKTELSPDDDGPPNTSSDVPAVLVVVAPLEANERTDYPAFAYSVFERATGRGLWSQPNVLCSGHPEIEAGIEVG